MSPKHPHKKSAKRLVLFDIDGTLLLGGPLWKESFYHAVQTYFPGIEFPKVPFSGKTDVQILREVILAKGFDVGDADKKLFEIMDRYVEKATELLRSRSHEVQVLPGVRELLPELEAHPDVILGLLTGNVVKGAELKLTATNLRSHFEFGVFGSDHWDRYKLPLLAVNSAKEKYGREFVGKEVVIIGDTIHDVNCGKSIGVRSIAVGTGRGVAAEDLLAQKPDFYFKDLSEINGVISAILKEI